MRDFKLLPEGFYLVRRRYLAIMSILIVALMAATIGIDVWYPKAVQLSYFAYEFPVLILLVVVTIGQLKNYRRLWESYELFISEQEITKKQYGVRDVTILKDQAIHIYESPDTGLKVVSKDLAIGIPIYINGYQEVKQILSKWKNFETKHASVTNLVST